MSATPLDKNTLYYGDNLDVLRKYIKDETVDLCYIDPPFNSKRNYNQIYNNVGAEDRAQAQAFVDTWEWDMLAKAGYRELLANAQGRFAPKTVDLIKGLNPVLGEGSLLAYLVSMALRINEIHRTLKPTGSFYLHCDPTASHYLKLLLDSLFLPRGGLYRNEIVWAYRKWSVKQNQFPGNHDTIFFYTKSHISTFHTLFTPVSEGTMKRWKGKKQQAVFVEGVRKATSVEGDESQTPMADWWDVSIINPAAKERMGYPTQKPEALLERIIAASTNEGDLVLDAYCGCGTTVAVAERLNRRWIGVDITYQSISLILHRLEGQYGSAITDSIILDGIPRDMESARALARKKDDRVRKEFEKWAILTYSNNRAVINDKKGADKGIDGIAYFLVGKEDNAKIVFQVKSGKVERGDIAKFDHDRQREGAEMGVFITLNKATKAMKDEANAADMYKHDLMDRFYNRIQIVTIEDIIERGARLDVPMSREVLKKAQASVNEMQPELL
ncbi:MAG: DNA methyltransferase [Chloroflexota bacterium]|nr:DNA methyltransferase [Chloroflexota bacterium]